MKNLFLAILFILISVIASADTYNVVEFSPLKATTQKAEYKFNDEHIFLYWSLTPDNNSVSIFGEYRMFTYYDGAAYSELANGASLWWFMKDERIIIGWRASIENKYQFNFYIIYGRVNE